MTLRRTTSRIAWTSLGTAIVRSNENVESVLMNSSIQTSDMMVGKTNGKRKRPNMNP